MIFTHCPFCADALIPDPQNRRQNPELGYRELLIFLCPKKHFSLQLDVYNASNRCFINWFHARFFFKENIECSLYAPAGPGRGITIYVQELDEEGYLKDPLSIPMDEYIENMSCFDLDWSSLDALKQQIKMLLVFS